MGKFTFDEKRKNRHKKEEIEWLRIWCEDATEKTLPRVAIVGDSITEQSFKVVQRELKGVAAVDYYATSYSILSPVYEKTLTAFIEDSDYAVVCYNYGLHSGNVGAEDYERAYRNILNKLLTTSKVVISLTTDVRNKDDLDKVSDKWADVVKERNVRAKKLAEEYCIPVNDLYEVSVRLGKAGKSADGVHFNDIGIEEIGKSKAAMIKKILS